MVLPGLTFGGTVNGDPVKDIVRTALENGINMFDEAENYTGGESEKEMFVTLLCVSSLN